MANNWQTTYNVATDITHTTGLINSMYANNVMNKCELMLYKMQLNLFHSNWYKILQLKHVYFAFIFVEWVST